MDVGTVMQTEPRELGGYFIPFDVAKKWVIEDVELQAALDMELTGQTVDALLEKKQKAHLFNAYGLDVAAVRKVSTSARTILLQYSWEDEEDVGKVQDCTCIPEGGTREGYHAKVWLAAEMKRFDVEIRWSTAADVNTERASKVERKLPEGCYSWRLA
ncbi:uncharacterized protein BT62DRAFT_923914 [Guyanagaster necrorhizus]|uniref:Uncharacterized protein n=1 Tax=Guyanagaster necrorhizus TaxID=856835 RepID=A0A9P8AME4_9AGAR|nr:uncharacterized protein BT62DRAFT_923914 [Guyanagaster necrorhizus MCA 3950]KAG7440601.1 hypothetical protein BT62DRAFT_923914 [Guyanagaster necrorhizus MCA 3950]